MYYCIWCQVWCNVWYHQCSYIQYCTWYHMYYHYKLYDIIGICHPKTSVISRKNVVNVLLKLSISQHKKATRYLFKTCYAPCKEVTFTTWPLAHSVMKQSERWDSMQQTTLSRWVVGQVDKGQAPILVHQHIDPSQYGLWFWTRYHNQPSVDIMKLTWMISLPLLCCGWRVDVTSTATISATQFYSTRCSSLAVSLWRFLVSAALVLLSLKHLLLILSDSVMDTILGLSLTKSHIQMFTLKACCHCSYPAACLQRRW